MSLNSDCTHQRMIIILEKLYAEELQSLSAHERINRPVPSAVKSPTTQLVATDKYTRGQERHKERCEALRLAIYTLKAL